MVITPIIALGVAAGVTLQPATPSITVSLSDATRPTCTLVLRNASSKPIQIWLAGFWPNHRLTMWDTAGKPVARTALGRLCAKRFEDPGRDKNAPMVLAPGKSYRYAMPSLVAQFELRPGAFTLSVVYRDKSFGKPLNLTCGKVKVGVVKWRTQRARKPALPGPQAVNGSPPNDFTLST